MDGANLLPSTATHHGHQETLVKVPSENEEFELFQKLEERLITVMDASQIEVNGESLSTRQLQRLIQEKKIAGLKLGRMYITSQEAVQDYLHTERRTGPKTK